MLAKISMASNAIGFIWELVKGIRELVKLVENDDIEDGEKHGEEKKNLILDLIGVVYDAIEQAVGIPIEKETVKGLADSTIELFVKYYNAIGKFRSLSN